MLYSEESLGFSAEAEFLSKGRLSEVMGVLRF